MAEETKYLYVKSALPGSEVALHEVDDAHPGGSAIVAGNIVAKVADTPFVRARLRDRWLVEADDSKEKSAADKWSEERTKLMSATEQPTDSVFGDVEVETPEAEGRAEFNKAEVERIAKDQEEGRVDPRDPNLVDKASRKANAPRPDSQR